MRFKLVAKRGLETAAELHGLINVRKDELSLTELERVPEIEAFLEKLTGYRVHIEQEASPIRTDGVGLRPLSPSGRLSEKKV